MKHDEHPISDLFTHIALQGIVFLVVLPIAIIFPILILYSPWVAFGLILFGFMGRVACVVAETMWTGHRRTRLARRKTREDFGQ